MSPDNFIIICKNIYYRHTYLTLATIAGLALFFYLKPKAALKTLGVLLVFALVIYSFSILGKSSSTGMNNKKQMINQTLDKIK